jgi:hypothetical protein
MNDASLLADMAERRRALDPTGSFIVQAPAGSGKTELLIQRYLVLLSCVERPEEITAITFTRKAASEMRKRVLGALADARAGLPPDEPHRALTWEHARRALKEDARRGWNVEDNPARLRIQTIDALCASLTRQMPVLSSLGAQPDTIEDGSALYREAARAPPAPRGGARRCFRIWTTTSRLPRRWWPPCSRGAITGCATSAPVRIARRLRPRCKRSAGRTWPG